MSSTSGGSAGGVSFLDEDILAYDQAAGTWSMFFDGGDVGLTTYRHDVDAFALLPDGSILLSVYGDTTLPDVGVVDESDIVRFVPTSLGEVTAGTFEPYFDASDVGLDTNVEDVDAFSVLANGDLIFSVLTSFSVGGASGVDEDLLRFTPTSLGANTSGTFATYFDGSDVGLADSGSEDVAAAWVEESSGNIYLSTIGAYAVSGASGDGADIFVCSPGSLGATTSCTFSPFWDGSAHGFGGEVVDATFISLGGAPGPTPTSTGVSPTDTPAPEPTFTPQPTDTPAGPTPTPGNSSATIYVSSSSGGTVDGVIFGDEDILAYDQDSGAWSLYFDGTDMGMNEYRHDIDAFALQADGSILLSILVDATLPDVGSVDDSDIVRFVPTTLGEETAGTFEIYFDASDVGLTTNREDVDAFAVLAGGDLIFSVITDFDVSGASGADEDLLRFTPTSLGANTAGTFSAYFDGSDVGLNDSGNEDIWAAWVDDGNGDIYLSTLGAFAVSGAAGDASDIFVCSPGSLGATTSCTFSLYWDGSAHGFGGEGLDALFLMP